MTGDFVDSYIFRGSAQAGATVVVWWNNPAGTRGWQQSIRTKADDSGRFEVRILIGPWSGDVLFAATEGELPTRATPTRKVLLRSAAETLRVDTTGERSGADFIAGSGEFILTGLARPGRITLWWNQPRGNRTWRPLTTGTATADGSFEIRHGIGPWPGELGFTVSNGTVPPNDSAAVEVRMVLPPVPLAVASTGDSQGTTFIGGQGDYVYTGRTTPNSPVVIWWDTNLDRSNWRIGSRGRSDAAGDFRITAPIGPWSTTIHWSATTGERPTGGTPYVSTTIVQSPSSFTVGTTGTKIGDAFQAGTGRYVFSGTAMPNSKVSIWWNNPNNSAWYESISTTADASGRYLATQWVGPDAGQLRFTATAGTRPGWWNVAPVEVTLVAGAMQPWVTPAYSGEVGAAWRPGCPVAPGQLSKIDMNYWTPQGTIARGSIMVRSDLTQRTIAIFQAAFDARFPITKMRLPSEYPGAKDELMMADDNTSGFNCRTVVGNPYRMSPHSYGYAIDINTVKNPYYAAGRWYPSSQYSTGRSAAIPGMHTSGTVFPQQFRAHGGHWGNCYRDYHHFELTTKRC
ncbi:MAG: M15 family metallopeptidase [Propionibacteriaceae bacterium]|nr:M15 family metallopeptidase [Propionibacteriaceae bacterium]